MWGRRKKEDFEHISASSVSENEKEYMFEKTKLYTLTSDQVISVPPNMIARVYFDYADPLIVHPCTKKNLIKAAKIRADKHGKQFYVLYARDFSAETKDWAIGKIPLNFDGIDFQVGANGLFRFFISSPKSFVSKIGKGESKVYRTVEVVEAVREVLKNAATEILKLLFSEVGALVTKCAFLNDEYALRLTDYFIRDAQLREYGIEIISIEVSHVGVRAEDKMEAQKALINIMRHESEAERKRSEAQPTDTLASVAATEAPSATVPDVRLQAASAASVGEAPAGVSGSEASVAEKPKPATVGATTATAATASTARPTPSTGEIPSSATSRRSATASSTAKPAAARKPATKTGARKQGITGSTLWEPIVDDGNDTGKVTNPYSDADNT